MTARLYYLESRGEKILVPTGLDNVLLPGTGIESGNRVVLSDYILEPKNNPRKERVLSLFSNARISGPHWTHAEVKRGYIRKGWPTEEITPGNNVCLARVVDSFVFYHFSHLREKENGPLVFGVDYAPRQDIEGAIFDYRLEMMDYIDTRIQMHREFEHRKQNIIDSCKDTLSGFKDKEILKLQRIYAKDVEDLPKPNLNRFICKYT